MEAPSFHHLGEPPRRKRGASKSKKILATIVSIIVFLVLAGGVEAYAGYHAYAEAMTGRAAVLAAADEVKNFNFSAAATHLHDAAQHLAAAKNYLKPLAPLTVLPIVGNDVKAAREIVDSSYDAVLAFGKIADVGDNLMNALSVAQDFSAANLSLRSGVEAFFRLPVEDRQKVLATLDGIGDKLNASTDLINAALRGFINLPPTKFLSSVTSALAPIVDELKTSRDDLDSAKSVADLLPSLSGYPMSKTYLVLLENNTELRPTGGFIGLLASVQISAGGIGNIKAEDVYSVDGANGDKLKTVPPAPLAKYLNVKKWFLRDANWSPDFPTSAKKVVEFYKTESGAAHIDGVISADISFAQDLLKIVGPVTIGSSTFTAENAADEIEFQVEKGFDKQGLPIAQRKDVVIGLIYEIFKRATALPQSGWQKVVDALVRDLAQKHVQIAPFDAPAAAYAGAHNYDGALKPYSDDTLALVDANLAAFKTDGVVDRKIDYKIVPNGKDLVATATATYKNNGTFSWKTTRYRDYLRLYVPAGSVLVSSKGAMENDKILDPKHTPGKVDSYEELGRHVFGAFISVEPGATGQISFTYRLPPSVVSAVASGVYRLDAIKEAGTDAVPLTLGLDFGKNIKQATPPEARENWGDRLYSLTTDLLVDREFDIGF
jgi:Protein of unknown function (DUF4012)